MLEREPLPVVLSIAGSDSGGGAGIQADLKTFAALGVHGTTAITGVTAQNPRSVRAVQLCPPRLVRQQIEAVFDELHPAAVKTGMLGSSAIIGEVAGFFARGQRPPLVVDPVMVSTSGANLLEPGAIKILIKKLLPLAALITPNVQETELLLGAKLRRVEDLAAAARTLHERFGSAALVKGGHLPRARQAVDFFYDGQTELQLRARFIRGVKTHGTGCTYSAAIAAYLAMGCSLPHAVKQAKEYITQAIARIRWVHGHPILNHAA